MSTRTSFASELFSHAVDGLTSAVWRIRMPLAFAGGVFAGAVLMFMILIAAIRSDPAVPPALAQELPQHDWSDVITLALVLVAGLAFWCGTLLKGPAR